MNTIVTCDLGWCVAKMDMSGGDWAQHLTILSPSCTEDGAYTPAADVRVYGRDNLAKLQAFLNQHLAAEGQS